MPIKFRCPNAACGRALTVKDEAAGRTAKCPGCGEALVVPWPETAGVGEPAGSMPGPVSRAASSPVSPAVLPPRGRRTDDGPAAAEAAPGASQVPKTGPVWPGNDLGEDAVGAPDAGAAAVVSFDAIGLAWGLLKRRMGTWVLAVLIVGFTLIGTQMALNMLAFFAGIAEAAMIGGRVPLSSLGVLTINMMVQGVLVGGLYKMALKQIDGGDIRVGDVFAIGGVAPGLALAGLITAMGTYLGLMILVIPGVIFAGLVMFTMPAVVEGFGAVDAVKRSFEALKRSWHLAMLFVWVAWMIVVAGALLCGVGLLFTAPLYVLAVAVQYRRSFAPGGMARKAVVADPWAEAVGKPAGSAGSGRVPAWAWGVLGLGVVLPVGLFAGVIVLLLHGVQAARRAAEEHRALAPPGVARVELPAPRAAVAIGDPVEKLLADLKARGASQPFSLMALENAAPDDAHREAVVAAVVPLLDAPQNANLAAQVLEKWAAPDDVPALIAGLDSGNRDVREPLIRALGRLRAEEAIPALVRHLAVPDDRGEASRALREIGPKAAPEIRKLLTNRDRDVRHVAADLLREIQGSDGSTLMTLWLAALRSPDRDERSNALENLGRTPPVAGARRTVLAAAVPMLKDPEPDIRRRALKVIETWGAAGQVPALLDLLDDPDKDVQKEAVAALGKIRDPRAALGLARQLESPELRRPATDALVAMKVRDEQVEAEVLKALDNSDPSVRQAACQVLRAIGTEASVPALRKALTDENRSVAAAARAALNAIDPAGKAAAPPPKTKARKGTRKR